MKWHHRHLVFFISGLVLAIILAGNPIFRSLISGLGTLGYLGAFIAGLLYVSSLTVGTSVVIISGLAQDLSPIMIGLIGGLGGTLGDYLIYKFVKDDLTREIGEMLTLNEKELLKKLVEINLVKRLLPIVGTIIIALPLPNEIGVTCLGLSNLSQKQFFLISFVANAVGITLVASVVRIF
ncbi:MAG: hypothetical protein Q7S88_01710 [Candidatus Daviesbacteria bacterium]|nr:hypothetical protein [Candidatus Daviesbacteria bacterium]